MNLSYYIIYLYLFSLLYLKINTNEEDIINDVTIDEYISLLNWAKKNSLNITNNIKLELSETEEKEQYKAINNISKGEIILDIPQNITININTFYDYFPSLNLKDKYEKYLKKIEKSKEMINDKSYISQSFMAFLFYKINNDIGNNKENPELNKFNDNYKYLFYLFKEDLSHIPSSFTDEKKNTFMNTSFSSFFYLMNEYLIGESNILKENIFKEEINLDEYFKYRFILLQKTYNISNTITLVPFVDFIKKDFNKDNINCKLVVHKNHIRIKAIKNIKKGDLLILKQKKMTNKYSYFFYGKTYDELIDYVPSFIIPVIIPGILIDEGFRLDIDENEEENKIDLVWDKFYEIILPTYQEIMHLLKKDESEINSYNLFLKYLKLIRDSIKTNTVDELDDIFDNEQDIHNVERIIQGEISFLNKKIKVLENVINKIKNREVIKNKDNKNSKDKEFDQDL